MLYVHDLFAIKLQQHINDQNDVEKLKQWGDRRPA